MPLLGIEAEIAFRFERDLPAGKYSYAQVADAVTAFAAIEIVDSRFRTYPDLPLMDRHADCVSNGGFVRGPGGGRLAQARPEEHRRDAHDRRHRGRAPQRRPSRAATRCCPRSRW